MCQTVIIVYHFHIDLLFFSLLFIVMDSCGTNCANLYGLKFLFYLQSRI